MSTILQTESIKQLSILNSNLLVTAAFLQTTMP